MLSSAFLRLLMFLPPILIAALGFPSGSLVKKKKKKSTCNTGDVGDTSLIPGSGRSSGGGHGNPLQYSCLESITDRGPWRVTVHRVAKSWTWLKWLRVFYSIAKVPFRTDILWLQAMLRAWEFLEPSACAHWKCLLGGGDEDKHHARFLTGDAGEQIA